MAHDMLDKYIWKIIVAQFSKQNKLNQQRAIKSLT